MKHLRKIHKTFLLALATLIVVLFTGSHSPISAGENSPNWSYGGSGNPTQWGRLGNDFAVCEVGRDQSPIDISNAVGGAPARIRFNYEPSPLVVFNNGHTVQVNYEPGSSVIIRGRKYELLQFHFHTPSDHTISGKAAAMELHLVHRNQAGTLAVVGILLEAGTANPSIDKIWQHIPEAGTTEKVEGVTLNAADFLPSNVDYFSYPGSLTTPPCSEDVKWHVLTEPVEVSAEQIATFESLYQVNARPIQSTNGRIIQLHQ